MNELTGIGPVMRQIPTLAPEDSVSRALSMLRYAALDTLPVVDSAGRLVGILTLQDLRTLLVRDRLELLDPVRAWAREPGAIARPTATLDDARQALVTSGETTIPVVDDRGVYLGVVGFADLIEPIPVRARPAQIGGMATPWGVYLTNGAVQAGVGNIALVCTGVVMGALLAIAIFGTGMVAHLFDVRLADVYFSAIFSPEPQRLTIASGPWVIARTLPMLIFLLLLRAMPLAQYHAAEHQAVHAMERGEPLRAEIVSRMPRVHPRCGTNIMAAGLVFTAGFHGLMMLGGGWFGTTDSALLAALMAVIMWRRVGAFLQTYFTTRRAGAKHIASGLAAAEELEDKFQQSAPVRPRILRRIWCMGLPQILVGVSAGFMTAALLLDMAYRRMA